MSSKKKRLKTKRKSIPTLDFLPYKSFKMIDGQFKGLNIYLVNRNPHGRWSMCKLGHGSGYGQFRQEWSYIDEVEFFRCVEWTPEIKQFKRDLALKQLIY